MLRTVGNALLGGLENLSLEKKDGIGCGIGSNPFDMSWVGVDGRGCFWVVAGGFP